MKTFLFLSLLLGGCGYRFQGSEQQHERLTTISVPYIPGDTEGFLNQEIIRAIATSPYFEYRQKGGAVTLDIAMAGGGSGNIGYRYDRVPTSGERRVNIVATENRRSMGAIIKLVDSLTQEVLVGPVTVTAQTEYDYVDQNSIHDLTFTPPGGKSQTVIDFSLGQLDSSGAADSDAGDLLYRLLAQKILDGISAQDWEAYEEEPKEKPAEISFTLSGGFQPPKKSPAAAFFSSLIRLPEETRPLNSTL